MMIFAEENRTRTTDNKKICATKPQDTNVATGRLIRHHTQEHPAALATCRPQCVANHFGISLYKNRIVSILSFSFAGFVAEQVATIGAAALGLT